MDLIIHYICTVVNRQVIFYKKKKRLADFCASEKSKFQNTHVKQKNAPCYRRGVFPVCAYRASTPSLADRQMPYRFFYLYRFAIGHKPQFYCKMERIIMKVPFSSQSICLFCWLRTKRLDVFALEKAENIRQSYYCGILNVCSLVYMRH